VTSFPEDLVLRYAGFLGVLHLLLPTAYFLEVFFLWLESLFDLVSLWRVDFTLENFFLAVGLISVEVFLSWARRSLTRLSVEVNLWHLNL
jgi:hypothetical protein